MYKLALPCPMTSLSDLINFSFHRLSQYAKVWIRDPQSFFLYTFGRFELIRDVALSFHKGKLSSDISESVDGTSVKHQSFEGCDVKNIVQILKKDGLYLGFSLPTYVTHEIQNFSKNALLFANGNPEFLFTLEDRSEKEDAWKTKIVIGDCLRPGINCKVISDIINDPTILEIASYNLECKPVHIGTRLFWSFATEADSSKRLPFAQVYFHYDMYDYRALTFFFYLSDVDFDSGSHICVKGTHSNKRIRHKLSLFLRKEDQEIVNSYGESNIISIQGKAGFGFIEDPYCFHKAMPPISSDRLMLMISYGIRNLPTRV
jgi:hypothetical protein